MKTKVVALLLFTIYVWTLLQPILPILDYSIRYDYISEKFCINKDKPELKCNGKCYLMQQLKESDPSSLETNTENQTPPSFWMEYLSPVQEITTIFQCESESSQPELTLRIPFPYLAIQLPPPELA